MRLERILTFSYLPILFYRFRIKFGMTVTLGTYRQRHNISLARQMPVKKASTAGIVGGLWKKIASLQFFPRSFLAKTALFFPKRNNAPSLALLIKAIPRKAPSKRKCRKKKISKTYLQDSKMMSARKITARAHVTTGISFAFLPAHFAIT